MFSTVALSSALEAGRSSYMRSWIASHRGGKLSNFCARKELNFLEYKDGGRHLDALSWEAYLKEIELARYRSMQIYYPPPDSYNRVLEHV
ncbi:hypothetical protein N7467_007726 [Penicillium canescens]|nr:hypothetical protein N7467_007726 [Penicillium canescens]